MTTTPLPWIELFEAMQFAFKPLGISLGMEQYEWLRQSMAKGYGIASWNEERIESWENLRRVTRLLWVKPLPSYEAALKVFDRTFDQYLAEYQDCLPQGVAEGTSASMVESTRELEWPTIPSRKGYASEKIPTGTTKTLAAVQTASPRAASNQKYILTPQDLPLTLEKMQQQWRSLRQSVREGGLSELDLDETVAQMTRRGLLDDLVMRPVMQQRAELVVLVDDGAGMVPFRRTIAPLIRAVEEGFVSPGRIYRFTTYPDQYLYGWRQSSQATAIAAVLAQWHQRRTVVMVVSDAGAATGIVRGEQVLGALDFVERVLPCVRQLIWLNPLPRERWVGTSAEAIDRSMGYGMISLDEFATAVLRSRALGGVLL